MFRLALERSVTHTQNDTGEKPIARDTPPNRACYCCACQFTSASLARLMNDNSLRIGENFMVRVPESSLAKTGIASIQHRRRVPPATMGTCCCVGERAQNRVNFVGYKAPCFLCARVAQSVAHRTYEAVLPKLCEGFQFESGREQIFLLIRSPYNRDT